MRGVRTIGLFFRNKELNLNDCRVWRNAPQNNLLTVHYEPFPKVKISNNHSECLRFEVEFIGRNALDPQFIGVFR